MHFSIRIVSAQNIRRVRFLAAPFGACVEANTQIEVPTVVMHSWNALDPVELKPAAFLRAGIEGLRTAARYVNCLPYARNSHPDDPLIVLTEHRGIYSTKHALIRRLAMEQDRDIALVLGMYEMTEQILPESAMC